MLRNRKFQLPLLIFISIFFSFCKNREHVTIIIQPFEGTPNSYVEYVSSELIKIYPKVKIKPPIPFPKFAYYAPRNRYKADSLIKFLSTNTPENAVTIGITNKDISSSKGNIKDYGLMGLGYMPGPSCVVSSYRLNKSKIPIQLFKTAIHELGHTQGIDHCPIKSCFMRDAEGENRTDEEKEFCNNCKKTLKALGWIL